MVVLLSNRIITPLFCTAIAAVIGFYFLYYAHIALTITILSLALFVLCLFRVLSAGSEQAAASKKLFVCVQNPRLFRILYFCSTTFAVGLVLGICAANAGRNDIKFGLPDDKILAVEGMLLEDPRILPGGSAMASLSLRRSTGDNVRVSSSGEITLFFPQESAQKLREFGRKTVVFAEGNLRSTNYGQTFSADSLHIVKIAPAIERFRTGIRLNLINRFEGKSWGGLTLALLVGIRDNLDVNLTTVYRDAGLSYILALSGMHLAIITALIAFLLKKPLGLKAASIIGAVIISLYCLLVGPMPSLNRSAIMYLLGVFTILAALPKKSMSVLCLSFLIQIIITPAAGNSLSFILSYLALLGILVTSRHITSLLSGIIPDFLLQPLSLSCGAFLATAGICSFSFGTIAPVGIIAGLFIVPLTTLFMTGGLVWLVLDIFSLSFILNMPLSWLYRLMEIISSLAGYVPGIRTNPVIVLAVSIVLLIAIAILNYRRQRALVKLSPFL
jgi:competence protein ComEC